MARESAVKIITRHFLAPAHIASAAFTQVALPAGPGRRLLEGLAAERLGENTGHAGLADSTRTGEEIGVSHAAGLDGVHERPGHCFLPENLLEEQGTVSAGKNDVGLQGHLQRGKDAVGRSFEGRAPRVDSTPESLLR